MNRHRRVSVGQSVLGSAREAGMAAAQEVCDPDLRLLVVFSSHKYSLGELVDAVGDVARDVPVIGCSTVDEIGPMATFDSGVVVVGFSGDFAITVGHATDFTDPRRVGETVARALLPLPDLPHKVVLMLTDSLAGDQQEMIRGAYAVLGAHVALVGGGAGDDMRMVTSRQVIGRKVMTNAVVAACIASEGPFGLSVRHGWHCQGEAMMVTASRGNDVYTLDDRPALDVYLERHEAPAGIETDRAAFAEFALTRPLNVARRGDVAVRHVLGADPAVRKVYCAGTVPRGAALWLASGDIDSTLAAADLASAEAIGALGRSQPLAMLVFDCAGRRAVLGGAGLKAERQAMRERAGTAPVAGFYSYGEIARITGANGFHNQTIVTLALS
jgi:hypothetical protein